jgi:chromosome segregation ATPase
MTRGTTGGGGGDGTLRGRELREAAARMGFFSSMSSSFRQRISAALGAAAELEEERATVERQRAEISGHLASYGAQLDETTAALAKLLAEMRDSVRRTNDTQRATLDVQDRTLRNESRARDLAALENRVVQLAEDASKKQDEGRRLLDRLEEEQRMSHQLQEEVRSAQDAVARLQEDLARRAADADRDAGLLAEREKGVARGEGVLAAGETDLRRRAEAQAKAAEDARARDARLDALQDRLEKDQAAVNEAQKHVALLVEKAQQHERTMDGHYKSLEDRIRTQDGREDLHRKVEEALRHRTLDQDRERVALDGRIERLADLDARHELLMKIQGAQEEEKRRLHDELAEVRKSQRMTVETWGELKATLVRLEQLETRIQGTNDEIKALRAETEKKDRESADAARKRALGLDRREREILTWRMNAEIRERRVQERFNDLERVETDKLRVRREIAELESQQASRVAEFEKEQQRQRTLWAERRAEAEKARELYERNVEVVEKRLQAVLEREGVHERRAAELTRAQTDLAERERLLAAREEALAQLRAQRDSLNAVIASLATQVGREWASPETSFASGLEPPPLDAPLPLASRTMAGERPAGAPASSAPASSAQAAGAAASGAAAASTDARL